VCGCIGCIGVWLYCQHQQFDGGQWSHGFMWRNKKDQRLRPNFTSLHFIALLCTSVRHSALHRIARHYITWHCRVQAGAQDPVKTYMLTTAAPCWPHKAEYQTAINTFRTNQHIYQPAQILAAQAGILNRYSGTGFLPGINW
jgi:hypothetical protein